MTRNIGEGCAWIFRQRSSMGGTSSPPQNNHLLTRARSNLHVEYFGLFPTKKNERHMLQCDSCSKQVLPRRG
jgi:hypothetical protein